MIRSALARFATKVPTCCAVCHRTAWWLGYSSDKWGKGPFLWFCDTCAYEPKNKKLYTMKAAELDHYERQAIDEAGNAAGSYLDELGKTDLATLTEGEWNQFLQRIVVGFETNMRRIILEAEGK